jgi:hypothetical protein
MIPNIVDEMGLSAAAVRLYVHFRRVAGEDGVCWTSYKTKSKVCRLDQRTIKKAEKELVKAGLITTRWSRWAASHGSRMLEVRINQEVWERNNWRYSSVSSVSPMAECATSGGFAGVMCKPPP